MKKFEVNKSDRLTTFNREVNVEDFRKVVLPLKEVEGKVVEVVFEWRNRRRKLRVSQTSNEMFFKVELLVDTLRFGHLNHCCQTSVFDNCGEVQASSIMKAIREALAQIAMGGRAGRDNLYATSLEVVE